MSGCNNIHALLHGLFLLGQPTANLINWNAAIWFWHAVL